LIFSYLFSSVLFKFHVNNPPLPYPRSFEFWISEQLTNIATEKSLIYFNS